MASIETLKETYSLPDYLVKIISEHLGPGEEILSPIGPARLDWLKLNVREAGHRFLAATTVGKILNLYVMTGDGVGVIDFSFRDDPLDDLWLATVSARFRELPDDTYIVSVPHRPN